MKTKKEKENKSVNEKFVSLLNRTFDKYKDINVLVRGGEENVDPDEDGDTPIKLVKSSTSKPAKEHSKQKSDVKSDDKKAKHLQKLSKRKKYTPAEDKIILKTINSAKNKYAGIRELVKVLNRTESSVRARVDRIQTGLERKKKHRPFSLQEDFLIIDDVLENLKQCKSLELTELQDYNKLAKNFDRPKDSVSQRWNARLKMWLLQYYQKTLNLEIRPMLINVLAENFDSIESIDWDWVKKIPEFSGYTATGLKRLFITKTIHNITRTLELERTDMTLTQLKEAAKDFNFYQNSKRKGVLEERQKKVICYFEKHVKIENIEFRELCK